MTTVLARFINYSLNLKNKENVGVLLGFQVA